MSGTRIRQNYSDAISLAKEISASEGVLVSVCRSADGKWTLTWWSKSEEAESAANPPPPRVGKALRGNSSRDDVPEWLSDDVPERLSDQESRYSGEPPAVGGYSSDVMAWSNPYRGMAAGLASPQRHHLRSGLSESTRYAAVTQRLLCHACGGDGGPGGRCPKCGGNGIDPDRDAHRSAVI